MEYEHYFCQTGQKNKINEEKSKRKMKERITEEEQKKKNRRIVIKERNQKSDVKCRKRGEFVL